MVKKLITVELSSGLEARPAAMLVQVASQYESKIYLEAEAKRVNAKSIMGMMTLCLTAGKAITVEAEGCLLYTSHLPQVRSIAPGKWQ